MYQKRENAVVNGKKISAAYPVFEGGKSEERINAAIRRIVAAFEKSAKKKNKFNYFRATCRVTSENPVSLLFEFERRGADKAYSYSVLPLIFTPDGFASAPVTEKARLAGLKRALKERGVKAALSDIRYSFYVSDGKTFLCVKKPASGRAKRDLYIMEIK